ncbi:hypothetical protein [Streptomyces sp. NPDC008092]
MEPHGDVVIRTHTGAASPVTDPAESARYLTPLTPWGDAGS